MATTKGQRRITLIQSDEGPDEVRKKVQYGNLVDVELVVRSPDNEDVSDTAFAARLCSCRRVCVAIVEE